jgi:maltose alpha-D-glucosyltransferase/alpha-amylase
VGSKPGGAKADETGFLINLLSPDHSRAAKNGKHYVALESYGYRWYRVGGLDYLLKRSEF